jgi:hypothetical protein
MCANDLHAAQLCCFKYLGARARSLSGDMHGPDVACSKARSSREAHHPAAGDTRTAVAIGPSWWPGLPAACTPLFLLYRLLASLWLPLIALMYSITTSVQLHFTTAAVPPHLLPPPGQPGCLSELDASRGWHAPVKPQSAVKPSSSRPRGRSFGRP